MSNAELANEAANLVKKWVREEEVMEFRGETRSPWKPQMRWMFKQWYGELRSHRQEQMVKNGVNAILDTPG